MLPSGQGAPVSVWGETPISSRYKTSVRHRSGTSTGCATRHTYSKHPVRNDHFPGFSTRGVSAVAMALALPPDITPLSGPDTGHGISLLSEP